MRAISISKDEYEAEEERQIKIVQQKLSDAVESKTKTVSNTANYKGKKMSKMKQTYHQKSDGDESLLIAAVSVVIQ
jgi:hypothetical protein